MLNPRSHGKSHGGGPGLLDGDEDAMMVVSRYSESNSRASTVVFVDDQLIIIMIAEDSATVAENKALCLDGAMKGAIE